MSDLPPDLVHLLLSHLNLPERIRAAASTKQLERFEWQHARELDLSADDVCSKISDASVRRILAACDTTHLHTLDFNFCTNLKFDFGLERFINLTSLSVQCVKLFGCYPTTESTFRDSKSMRRFLGSVGSLVNLRKLSLRYWKYLFADEVALLAPLVNLVDLDLHGCVFASAKTEAISASNTLDFLQNMNQLERLDLGGWFFLGNAATCKILPTLKTLKFLGIQMCRRLTAHTLHKTLSVLVSLEELSAIGTNVALPIESLTRLDRNTTTLVSSCPICGANLQFPGVPAQELELSYNVCATTECFTEFGFDDSPSRREWFVGEIKTPERLKLLLEKCIPCWGVFNEHVDLDVKLLEKLGDLDSDPDYEEEDLDVEEEDGEEAVEENDAAQDVETGHE